MLISQNLVSATIFAINAETSLYTTVHDTIHLTDFTEFDLVVDNPHLGTNLSSSKIEIYRNDSEYDVAAQEIKYIYSLPSDFDCFEFAFQIQLDIQYSTTIQIGYLEVKLAYQYNAIIGDNYADTIYSTSLDGWSNSVLYTLYWQLSSSLSGRNEVGVTTNIPESVICWNNQSTKYGTMLSINRLDTSSTINSQSISVQSENKLKYINIGYSAPSYNNNFSATVTNIDATLYSTEYSTVFNSNSSYSNTSKILGLVFPVFIGVTIFLGVGILVIRKRRD